MTTDDFATLLNIPKDKAYGLLRGLVAIGAATTTVKDREPGKKGKPTLLYTVAPEVLVVLTAGRALEVANG